MKPHSVKQKIFSSANSKESFKRFHMFESGVHAHLSLSVAKLAQKWHTEAVLHDVWINAWHDSSKCDNTKRNFTVCNAPFPYCFTDIYFEMLVYEKKKSFQIKVGHVSWNINCKSWCLLSKLWEQGLHAGASGCECSMWITLPDELFQDLGLSTWAYRLSGIVLPPVWGPTKE